LLPVSKSKNPSQIGNEVENEDSISDVDLDNIVGVGSSSELEVASFFRRYCTLVELAHAYRR
jgi:hypothetical protein